MEWNLGCIKIDSQGHIRPTQKLLFSLGASWSAAGQNVQNAYRFLYVDSSGNITCGSMLDSFARHAYGKVSLAYLQLQEQETRRTMPNTNTETNWKFHIQSLYQLDFARVAKDLDTNHPLALVKTDHAFYIVVDSYTLERKIGALDDARKILCDLCEIVEPIDVNPTYSVYKVHDFHNANWAVGQVVDIFKKVRKASIMKSLQLPTTVSVNLLEI